MDVFGNRVKTWKSYYNFKVWFDYIAENVPGTYINCTEGGIFGAYRDGNIKAVKQMPLQTFLNMCFMHYEMEEQFKNPESVSGPPVIFVAVKNNGRIITYTMLAH